MADLRIYPVAEAIAFPVGAALVAALVWPRPCSFWAGCWKGGDSSVHPTPSPKETT